MEERHRSASFPRFDEHADGADEVRREEPHHDRKILRRDVLECGNEVIRIGRESRQRLERAGELLVRKGRQLAVGFVTLGRAEVRPGFGRLAVLAGTAVTERCGRVVAIGGPRGLDRVDAPSRSWRRGASPT
jgi:hypothetical protein